MLQLISIISSTKLCMRWLVSATCIYNHPITSSCSLSCSRFLLVSHTMEDAYYSSSSHESNTGFDAVDLEYLHTL